MASQLKIELVVDDKGTVKIKDFAGNIQTEMKKAESHVARFSDATRNAFQVLTGLFTAGAILSGLRSVTTAFMEQERAVNKMTTAMKNQGDFSKAGLRDMEAFASQIQETTAVADEQALAVMANLKSYGMLNEEVKRAAQAAIDFASVKREEGMTVESASELIGKAYMGQTDRLKRYGIVIGENVKGSAAFVAVLKQLSERFGGAAAAELDTYEGRWKNLNNTWGDVKETLGELALTLGQTLQPALEANISLIQKAAEYWRDFMNVSAESTLKKRQIAILDELGKIETKYPNPNPNPNYFGQDVARFPANIEERYRALNAELRNVTKSLQGIAIEDAKVQPGGKRTLVSSDEDRKAAERENAKFLAEVQKLQEEAQKSLGLEFPNQARRLEEALDKADREAEAFLSDIEKLSQEAAKSIEEPIVNMAKRMEEALKDPDAFFARVGEKASKTSDDMKTAITGWASGFSETLNEALWDADFSFGNIAKSFAKMITQMVIQTQIIQPLLKSVFGAGGGGGSVDWFGLVLKGASAVSGWFGGGGAGGYTGAEMDTMTWLGKGGVFDKGALQAFGKGGVVHQPTLFKFASGVGLMGENGNEAIMPLARLPGGDLGVKAMGGAGNITVNVHNNAPAEVSTKLSDVGTLEIYIVDTMRRNSGAVADAWNAEARGGNRGIMNTLRRIS